MTNTARRQREIERTRIDIIQAAARAFAKLGFEGTTIHDIAREAGYTTTSLYAYYKGKQEIVDTLLSTMADEIERTFGAPPPAGLAFSQKLEHLLVRWAEFGEKWREALSVLFTLQDIPHTSGGGRKATRLGGGFFHKQLTAWLRSAASPEDLGGADPEAIACFLKGILHGANLLWQKRGLKDTRECVDMTLRIFLHGVSAAGDTTAGAEKRRRRARAVTVNTEHSRTASSSLRR